MVCESYQLNTKATKISPLILVNNELIVNNDESLEGNKKREKL